MASTSRIEFRLRRPARWLIRFASVMRRLQMMLPHQFVVAVTNRSWQMRSDGGAWKSVRIDSSGKVVH